MANISFTDYESRKAQHKSNTQKSFAKVGYFKLADDGDTAVVRFAYDSPSDFVLTDVHKVKVGDFFRYVSCLTGTDAGACPLCGSPDKNVARHTQRFFVKLISYSVDNNTKEVTATPAVWDRPADIAYSIIRGYNKGIEYGFYPAGTPISDVVFKVRRAGAKGSIATTYDVDPTNPVVYKPELYVKDLSAFNTLDLSKHSYLVKTAEEIKEYLTTGEFPKKEAAPVVEKAPTTFVQHEEGFVEVKPTPAPVQPVAAEVAQPTTAPAPSVSTNRPQRFTF